MKNQIVLIFTLALICFGHYSSLAQDAPKKIQTEEFNVQGVCTMCQKRIEKAALISGVMSATWDKDRQSLKVIYKPKKASLKEIKQAVADAGHDTDDIKAPDDAYATLLACCAYRDGVKVH